MSRGGRGGFRGARDGGLKGATWEYDADLRLETKPSDKFPKHPNLKRPSPFTEIEERQIKQFKDLQTQIHRGPLYTQSTKRNLDHPTKTFGEDQFNRQYGTNRKADMDPFLGVETYSMRYLPKKNDIPKLSGRPFSKELFPKELWSTLDGAEGEEVRTSINRAMQKKALILGSMKDPSEKTKAVLEKIFSVAGDGDDIEEAEDEVEDEAEVDSEFEDDEMAGDYDGEQYFDNGEDRDEGDGGGGDDDY
ncbi:uncharacterized protein BP5553_09594 [Venustampulla echinocandica]|uniref:DNA-directed RNA polymerase III subunit n=1 Tax=Venustampulla echinocandica TaxID=2656787 RepID=A0A370TBG2_9HELO|nr:uncharacterized protein BP5553_09594 [Venustampulla echinocandica]RDL31385.1 hypothetical protein BP5553_09594 [Venustampulla echinocandica]